MTLWYHPEINATAVLWTIPEDNSTGFTWADKDYRGQVYYDLRDVIAFTPRKLRKLGWILIGDCE